MSTVEELQQAIGLGNVTFAREEIERRRNSPVHVSGESVRQQHEEQGYGVVHLIDPKLNFSVRSIRLWINFQGLGDEAWPGWKLLGHRHLIDAVIYIVQGRGYSIIDAVRYDWQAGDFLCVPTFGWHRHVNEGDEGVIYIASTTTPFSHHHAVLYGARRLYPRGRALPGALGLRAEERGRAPHADPRRRRGERRRPRQPVRG
jgi:mannose-6-phosphate isomerase-like protein (cupin superfamily)